MGYVTTKSLKPFEPEAVNPLKVMDDQKLTFAVVVKVTAPGAVTPLFCTGMLKKFLFVPSVVRSADGRPDIIKSVVFEVQNTPGKYNDTILPMRVYLTVTVGVVVHPLATVAV